MRAKTTADKIQEEIILGIAHLKKDKELSKLIQAHGIWNPDQPRDYFQKLVIEIINQQLSTKAGDAIYSKFLGLFNDKFPAPAQIISQSNETLRKSGISRAKISYIKDLAQKIAAGQLDLKSLYSKDEKTIRQSLTMIKGVGPWTADMMLIFTYFHLDILPLTDLAIRKKITNFFKMKKYNEKKVLKLTAHWRPYRSIASWYLWRSI